MIHFKQSRAAWVFLSAILVATAPCSLRADHHETGVKVYHHGDVVRIDINGKLFTEYHYKDVPRPYFYPVIGPGGVRITRDYPMKVGEHDAKDHPHHRSWWYTHGNVNGIDFWHDQNVEHDGFALLQSGESSGTLATRSRWVAPDGKVVMTDLRTLRVVPEKEGHVLADFNVTFLASHGDVVMGDTKEGSMAIRLAPTLRVEGEVGQGTIVNSHGDHGKDAWGKRAPWVDYYGPIQGKTVGVAIFDHPSNPRHPTWWHVRTYGLFAANPFGIHNFENKKQGVGDFPIPAGTTATWKYRFYFHAGDNKEAQVEKHYKAYAQTP